MTYLEIILQLLGRARLPKGPRPVQRLVERLVEEAFMLCLSRKPTDAEKKPFVEAFAKGAGGARREALEDLFWALMTSREFLFQH